MSELLVIGLNHRTAPLNIREKAVFSKDELSGANKKAFYLPYIEEVIIISTCNRTEFITSSTEVKKARSVLRDFLSGEKNISKGILDKYFYSFTSLDAARHVFRVAAGLDSMIVGELQITGQLKEAYEQALSVGTCKSLLNILIQKALNTEKIIRNDTGISKGFLSVGTAAVELARKIVGDLSVRNALLIGAGEIAELTALHLEKRGIKQLSIINRTFNKAEKLAERFGGRCFEFDKMEDLLGQSDIVITSTGSKKPIITRQIVKEVQKVRSSRPIFFIDIAVPRDVDPEISSIADTYLYDIDDLEKVVEANIQQRQGEIGKAEEIITKRIDHFSNLMKLQDISPVISLIKEKAEKIRKTEVKKTLKKMPAVPPQIEDEIEKLTLSIVKKIFHDPIISFKKSSLNGGATSHYLKFIKDFFNLE